MQNHHKNSETHKSKSDNSNSYPQEIHHKEIKKDKPEVVEGEVVESKILGDLPLSPPSGWENFKTQLAEVLREANISRRQIYTFFLGLILVVVLIGSGVYGFRKFFNARNSVQPVMENTPKVPVTKNESQPDLSLSEGVDLGNKPPDKTKQTIDSSLDLAMAIGISENTDLRPIDPSGIGSGILIGGGSLAFMTDLERLVLQLKKLSAELDRPVMADLEELSLEIDRRTYVTVTINATQKLLDETKVLYDDLTLQIDNFKADFESLTNQKNQAEKDFFSNLDVLSPDVTQESLDIFINLSKQQTEFKSRSNALTKIKEKIVTPYKKLEKRLTALRLNQEALIQGIKVVEVEGADLDLILKPDQAN